MIVNKGFFFSPGPLGVRQNNLQSSKRVIIEQWYTQMWLVGFQGYSLSGTYTIPEVWICHLLFVSGVALFSLTICNFYKQNLIEITYFYLKKKTQPPRFCNNPRPPVFKDECKALVPATQKPFRDQKQGIRFCCCSSARVVFLLQLKSLEADFQSDKTLWERAAELGPESPGTQQKLKNTRGTWNFHWRLVVTSK